MQTKEYITMSAIFAYGVTVLTVVNGGLSVKTTPFCEPRKNEIFNHSSAVLSIEPQLMRKCHHFASYIFRVNSKYIRDS